MSRPSPYWVSSPVDERGNVDIYSSPDLESARVIVSHHGGQIYHRVNFVDVTPHEDSPGLLWEWEDVVVDE